MAWLALFSNCCLRTALFLSVLSELRGSMMFHSFWVTAEWGPGEAVLWYMKFMDLTMLPDFQD